MSQQEIEKLLELAAKAPSAHNAQPWQVEYNPSGEIRIGLNEALVPSISDGTRRESIISVGCYVANLLVLLNDNDIYYHLVINEFSPRQSGYLAKIQIVNKPVKPDIYCNIEKYLRKGLSDQIINRHNDRGEYRSTDISSDLEGVSSIYSRLAEVLSLRLHCITDKSVAQKLGVLTADAMKIILELDSSKSELRNFVSSSENRKSDRTMQLSSLTTSNFKSVDSWLTDPSTVDREALFWKKSVESGPGFICISSYSDTRKDWLLTGILLELILLEITAKGYSHSIWASLIEIPLMVPQLMQVLAIDSRPLAIFRVGIPISPMPRTQQRAPLSQFAMLMT